MIHRKNDAHSNPSISYSDNEGILPGSDPDFDHKKYLNSKQVAKELDSQQKKLMMDKFLLYGLCELLLIDYTVTN